MVFKKKKISKMMRKNNIYGILKVSKSTFRV